MRFRFSLRSFLIVVAVLGVVFFPVANFLYQVKSQIWRQRVAVTRLEDAGSRAQRPVLIRPANDGVRYRDEKADWLVHLARDYIDPLAYEPRSEASLCSMGNQPLEAATCESLLASVRDLYQLQRLGV